jgi:predicted lipoprotein with Yx(FWY)xxD motif
MTKKALYRLTLAVSILLVLAFAGAWTAIAAEEVQIRTDVEIAGDLGLLIGDGNGLTAEYLAKSTTRLQAAIMFLRLKGLQDEAFAFKGTDNFADAKMVNQTNQAVLAYLKAEQELGWAGVGGGNFDPSSTVTAQQFYKVILEALGYKTETDFEYKDTISFAASKGLTKVAANEEFVNADIATATVEALKAKVMGNEQTLADLLVEQKVIAASETSVVSDARVDIAMSTSLGSYLVDGKGLTLYYFTKDATDVNSCTDKCITNWPIFYSEDLQIDSGLKKADFGAFVRADGAKQLTYKGWPLYYYVKDLKAGDTVGQNVGTVWFVIDPAADNGATSLAPAKTYQIEMKNYAFSSPTLTIEVGSSVTFTNMDTVEHNALAVDGSFATPLLKNGESATVKFDKAGVYDYYCKPHEDHMRAQIIVK